ncbi:hypothetical protein J2Z64_004223 [Oceanobacillus polygoni]|uniref:Uncharacterized protein n=1 Tax=Oceanobacillus polygoni TaxID=1235259 RepID=A0A9X1CEE2_9BACI|nr:hypothetical protein [Oceanobacillus polygoni]
MVFFNMSSFPISGKTEEVKLLTILKEHTRNSVLNPDGKTVYFIVDKSLVDLSLTITYIKRMSTVIM